MSIGKTASKVIIAALGSLVLGIGTASASVITWNVHTETKFDTTNTVINAGNGGAQSIQDHDLKWGTPYEPQNSAKKHSELKIDPSVGDVSVDTYTGAGSVPGLYQGNTGVILTHYNYVQKLGSSSLESTRLLNEITLTPTDPADSALSPVSVDFGISFVETPNSGTCSATGNTVCPDIFVFDNASLNHSFTYDGLEYFLSVFALGPDNGEFNVLNDAACLEAGVSIGCQGFVTEENAETPMSLGVTITTHKAFQDVPGPGSLALAGLGLLLIAGFVRRRGCTLPLA